jgi:hypothetical protein
MCQTGRASIGPDGSDSRPCRAANHALDLARLVELIADACRSAAVGVAELGDRFAALQPGCDSSDR